LFSSLLLFLSSSPYLLYPLLFAPMASTRAGAG
jgi:hypothetical protein